MVIDYHNFRVHKHWHQIVPDGSLKHNPWVRNIGKQKTIYLDKHKSFQSSG